MLTKEKIYESLSAYSPELETQQLILVELGQDPDADEYPDDILLQVAKVSESFGLAKQKVLEGTNEFLDTDSEIVQKASNMAVSLLEQEGITGFDPRSMLLLAQQEVFAGVGLGKRLNQIKKMALKAELQRGDQEILNELSNRGIYNELLATDVFSAESMTAFVEDVAPVLEPSSAFSLLDTSLTHQRQALVPKTQKQFQPPKVNVQKFLAEQRGQ